MPFRRLSILSALAASLLVLSGTGPATAAIALSAPGEARSLAGSFVTDDEVHLFDLTIGGTRSLDVVIETFSYAGGMLRDGTAVARGGFDPVLALFRATGDLIAQGSDDPAKIDIGGERNAYDDILRIPLMPGAYILSVSQHRNAPPMMLDFLAPGYGFEMAGWSDYTSWDCRGGSAAPFCDVEGAQRSGAFAVQVSTIDVATVPLPGGLALLLGGLVAVAALRQFGRDT